MAFTLLASIPFLFFLLAAAARSTGSQGLIQRGFNAYHASANRLQADIQPDLAKDYDLFDIVLVASVDGKFHALNRTSGQPLWSMSSFVTTTSVSAPSSLAPLVRTQHVDHDPDTTDDWEGGQETYIIEPQSGDIYVMTTPTSPLVRFPFSMAELVDISPFTSMDKDGTRVFVGLKETSLLLMELETGKIKTTLTSECPIPEEPLRKDSYIDLDELEDNKAPISAPTEVYIGRTDYKIAIHKKAVAGSTPPPVQNLSFSVYGPNNKDSNLQAMYRRTNDNAYIQSLPNGQIISFKAKSEGDAKQETPGSPAEGQPLWGHQFSTPIVAIFDVLKPRPNSQAINDHPFVLLQPRPKLQELFPNLVPSFSRSHPHLLPNLDSAYVGLVEETGSLFVMSPERYPLLVFGGLDTGKPRKRLDPPLPDPSEPTTTTTRPIEVVEGGRGETVDEITRLRKLREYEMAHEDVCVHNPYERQCLVGVRRLEDGDGHERRMQRLLDGPPGMVGGGLPSVETKAGATPAGDWGVLGKTPVDNTSERGGPLTIGDGDGDSVGGLASGAKWEAVVVTVLFGLVSLVFLWNRVVLGVGRRWSGLVAEKEREMRKHGVVVVDEGEGGVEDKVNGVDSKQDKLPRHVGDVLGPSIPITPLISNGDAHSHLTPPPSLPSVPAAPETPTPRTQTPIPGIDDGEESEGEGEGGSSATPGKRKTRRGKRGRKKKTVVIADGNGVVGEEEARAKEADAPPPPSALVLTSSSPKPVSDPVPSLIVSDTILGRGSHGTVVLEGSFQGRAVAVKRLLQDFVTLAAREVSILQESDDHPNVIRYYYQEAQGNFLYIALELCVASLADIVEMPDRDQWRDIAISFDPKKALKQIAGGLRHLHALKLVHRDIKPQNILISLGGASSSSSGFGGGLGGKSGSAGYRMLISDFGLCKKLDVDQTSFLPTAHGAMAAGSVGWRAPEILRGEVKLDDLNGDDSGSLSSRGSNATIHGSSGSGGGGAASSSRTRLTKSVDIFALGCLFYYTLTSGGHPFGDRFEREVNIMKNVKNLEQLDRFGEEGTEAKDLIVAMLNPESRERPDTLTCLLHPFFWDSGRRLSFLQDASDRFEIMCRDPKDPHLLTLERNGQTIVGNDWHTRLDKIFIENLGKYRKYDGKLVQDLLRALRNKKNHYQDLPEHVKRHLGSMPDGFLAYFTRRYPQLVLHVHEVIKDTGLHTESMFRGYFEPPES